MKKIFYCIIVLSVFTSCQRDVVTRQIVVPATFENLNVDNQEFNVVTTLNLVRDSVKVWTHCRMGKVPVVNLKTDFVHEIDQAVCTEFKGFYRIYKGILISEFDGNQSITEICFLSKDILNNDNLLKSNLGTFIKVKSVEDLKLDYYPENLSDKLFIVVK